jgi:hypothetical protein
MSLWLIMRISGVVAATWGPLPYDMSECLERTKGIIEANKKAFAEKTLPLEGSPLQNVDQLEVTCERLEKRPHVGHFKDSDESNTPRMDLGDCDHKPSC